MSLAPAIWHPRACVPGALEYLLLGARRDAIIMFAMNEHSDFLVAPYASIRKSQRSTREKGGLANREEKRRCGHR